MLGQTYQKINLSNTNKKDNTKSFLKNPNPHSLFFQPTTTYEVNKIVSNLKNKSSYGQDLVSSKILKATINTKTDPLCHIINLSLKTGKFPDKMKIAKVLSIFKSDDNKIFKNYRPISLLPVFSKILEKIVYNRLQILS